MNQFANETARQSKSRINELIDSIPCKTIEDKNKIFDWKIVREENKLVEISEDEVIGYNLRYCEKHGFCCHNGKHCTRCQSEKKRFRQS